MFSIQRGTEKCPLCGQNETNVDGNEAHKVGCPNNPNKCRHPNLQESYDGYDYCPDCGRTW